MRFEVAMRKIKYCYRTFVVLLVMTAIILLYIGDDRVGIDVSPQEANARIHHRFRIPATAERVRYKSGLRTSSVNVWISEEDFQKWAQERGWVLNERISSSGSFTRVIDSQGEIGYVPYSQGWWFRMEGQVGFAGEYDSDRGVASVSYFSN